MANTYLQRTLGTPTSAYKGTLSWWQKGASTNSTQYILACESGSERFLWYISSGSFGGGLRGTSSPPDIDFSLSGTPKFRDVSNWYNFVLSWDSTQSTASDRIKFYVNNVQYAVSSSGTSGVNDIPLNHVMPMNKSGLPFRLGSNITGGNYFTGLMSHIHLIDGTAYDATAFGETDATTGEWKIKTSPSVTYGTNGFFILKDGNSVTDQSGNSNNFTVAGGTLTKTEDNPSNVFCTLNRLNSDQPTGSVNISHGNLTFADGENGSNYSYASGTLGANSGKFYWETKVIDLAEIDQVGVVLASSNFMGAANSTGLQGTAYGGKGVQFSNGYKVGDGSGGAYMGGFSVNHIMMIALDLDNNKITFGRNGQWADGSGNANQTYANSTPAYTNLTAGEFYFPAQAKRAGGANYGTNHYNFGNGYFQTTAVSSAGTNASGIGIFEHDVPTGFTSLSTKGLNL